MSADHYIDGVLRRRWDDSTRLYTEWDAQGVQTSQRAYTTAENAEADISDAIAALESNRSTLNEQVSAAITTNNTIKTDADTYLAIASPTNAQVVAQVRALTQAAKVAATQRNKIIRLLINDFTDTE